MTNQGEAEVTISLPAQQEIDRYRLYALIEALENDLREVISNSLSIGGQVDLGSYAEKALKNMGADADAGLTGAAPIHYLDLGDEIDLLNERRELLPSDVAIALRKSTEALKRAVPARHRVMHFKPLLPDDLDRLLEAMNEAASNGVPLPAVLRVTSAIHGDPNWAPAIPMAQQQSPRTLNNLPLPEFDETGLVGRRGDVQRLLQMLKQLRYPVITILGPGGVGKTALAVQTLHDLADAEDSPFDAILWVSLKTDRLTAEGIQELRDPLTDLGELVTDLAEPLDDDFSGSIEELAAALEGLEVLVCIDNLETATGQDVLQLVDALPAATRFLFTSRVGIGQLERTYPLGPLEPSAAADLLRRAAKGRGLVPLASLSREAANDVVKKLACNPLAIRWFVLSVEAGQRPEAILENQDDLLRFCVENVWESLAEPERFIAQAMHMLEHPVTVQELALYLESTPDDLRRDVHGLQRRALVRHVALGSGDLAEAFMLTDTASLYVGKFAKGRPEALHELESRQRTVQASEERRKRDESRAPLAPQTVFVTQEVDRPAALVLRDALTHSRRNRNLDHALSLIDQAADMSPGYYEVDRVRGFVLSSAGRTTAATMAFEQALSKAPDEWHKGRVAYLFAGHIVRNERNPADAEPFAAMADSVFDSIETRILLATVRLYLGGTEEAIRILETVVGIAEGKQRRIAATMVMEARRRRAEELIREDAQPQRAIIECLQAARLGASFLNVGVSDNRMIEVMAECLCEGATILRSHRNAEIGEAIVQEMFEIAAKHQTTLQYAAAYPGLSQCTSALAAAVPVYSNDTVALIAKVGISPDPTSETGSVDRKLGKISHWRRDKQFGFIDSDFGKVFFHASAVSPPSSRVYISHDVPVAFSFDRDDKGRPRAITVTLFPAAEPDAKALQRRRVTVTSLAARRNYAFGAEASTGYRVFLYPAIFRDQRVWDRIAEGTELLLDLEITDNDKVRGARDSARLRT